MKTKYFFIGLLFLITTLFLITCSKSSYNSSSGGGGGGGNNSTTITISNMAYSNPNLQVAVGTKVTWVNNDNMVHTVTANNSSFNSGDIAYNGSYSYTFTTAGTYAYHCKYHSSMTGVVVVVIQ